MRRNLTLRVLCATLLVTAVLAPCVWAAEKPASSPWDKPISVEFNGARLGDAIDALLRRTGINYKIDPDIIEIQIKSMSIKNEPLRTAFANLLKATGTVQSSDKSGMISIAPGEVWSKKVTIDVKDVPLHDVLADLFKQAGVPDWTVDSDVPNPNFGTTVPGKDMPFIKVLADVAKGMGAKFGYGFVSAGDPWQRVIDMELKDVPLPDAIDALFKDTGKSYTLDPAVQQLKVTAVLKSIPLIEALKGVLKAAGAVYRVENNVYVIGPKPHELTTGGGGAIPGMPTPPGGLSGGPLDGAPGSGIFNQVISLKYVSAGDIASLVKAGRSQLSVSATSGNKLFLSGTAGDVADAMSLIQQLDDESALARTIRLKMTAKITVSTTKGPKKYEASTESVGAEQTASLLNLETQTPYSTSYSTVTKEGQVIKQSQLNFTRDRNVDATVVPTIGADGRIGLAGRGSFAFRTGPTPGKLISKDFDIAASAAPGKPVVVAAGSITLDTGNVDFSVTMIATPEQGRVHFAPPPSSPGYGGGYGGRGGQTDSSYGRSYGQTDPPSGYRSW